MASVLCKNDSDDRKSTPRINGIRVKKGRMTSLSALRFYVFYKDYLEAHDLWGVLGEEKVPSISMKKCLRMTDISICKYMKLTFPKDKYRIKVNTEENKYVKPYTCETIDNVLCDIYYLPLTEIFEMFKGKGCFTITYDAYEIDTGKRIYLFNACNNMGELVSENLTKVINVRIDR